MLQECQAASKTIVMPDIVVYRSLCKSMLVTDMLSGNVKEGEAGDTPGEHKNHCHPLRTQRKLIKRSFACLLALAAFDLTDEAPGQDDQFTPPTAGQGFLRATHPACAPSCLRLGRSQSPRWAHIASTSLPQRCAALPQCLQASSCRQCTATMAGKSDGLLAVCRHDIPAISCPSKARKCAGQGIDGNFGAPMPVL